MDTRNFSLPSLPFSPIIFALKAFTTFRERLTNGLIQRGLDANFN